MCIRDSASPAPLLAGDVDPAPIPEGRRRRRRAPGRGLDAPGQPGSVEGAKGIVAQALAPVRGNAIGHVQRLPPHEPVGIPDSPPRNMSAFG